MKVYPGNSNLFLTISGWNGMVGVRKTGELTVMLPS